MGDFKFFLIFTFRRIVLQPDLSRPAYAWSLLPLCVRKSLSALRASNRSTPAPAASSSFRYLKKNIIFFYFFFCFAVDTYFVFLYLKDTSFLERYQSGRTGAVLKTVDLHGSGGSNPSRSDSWRCGRAVIQRIANPSVPKGLGRFNSCRLRY